MNEKAVLREIGHLRWGGSLLITCCFVILIGLAGATRAQTISLDFAVGFVWGPSGFGSALGQDITTDAAGNVYTTGYFGANFDFDPGDGVDILPGNLNNNVFISKLTATGTLVWAREISSSTSEWGHGIAVDDSMNVYVVGSFNGTLVFGSGQPNEQTLVPSLFASVFVCKYNEGGLIQWARNLIDSTGSVNDGLGIAVDANGNIYVTGSYQGAGVFAPDNEAITRPSSNASFDIFVAKMDTTGALLWVNPIGADGFDGGTDIAVAEGGDVYVTGFFSNDVDFNPNGTPQVLSSGIFTNVFVYRVDTNGAYVWAKRMGGAKDDRGLGIAIDVDGNVLTTGYFKTEGNFDPDLSVDGILTTDDGGGGYPDNLDVFVSKLNSAGEFVWARSLGGTPTDHASDIAVDGFGNVSVTGYFQGNADLNTDADNTDVFASVNNSHDTYVVNINAAGDFMWAVTAGSLSIDEGLGIATGPNGSIVTTGLFTSLVNFDPNGTSEIDSGTNTGVFVWKVTPGTPGLQEVFIHGAITDEAGDPIFCSALLVENRSLGFESETVVFMDLNGEYAITGLAVGNTGTMNALFDLSVSAPGFTFSDGVVTLATDDFNAETGEAIVNFTLVEAIANPATSVSGILRDAESGALLAGVRVEALLIGDPFDPPKIVFSCADGRFEIQDLPSAKVSSDVTLDFAAPDYDGQLLSPPDPGVELEVGMEKAGFFPNLISGLVTRVIDAQPVDGAFVTVQLSLGTLGFTLETGGDGFYQVVVPADGLYNVTASASNLDTGRGEGTVGPGMTTATVSLALPEEGSSGGGNGGCSASPRGVSDFELGDVLALFLVSLICLLRHPRRGKCSG